MALINKHLLQKTLKENRHQILNTQKIFDHLKIKIYDRIQSKTFKKEEAEKPVILPKLFELLGYSHPENFEFEFANQSRSADITLGVESQGVRQPEVMIEWKGIDTTSLDKGKAGETPVSQMWDYIGKTNANFGIVSNFKEFRLYSKQKGQTEFYQVYLEDIINNTDKLEEFVFLFRKTTLLKGDNKQSFLEDLISQSETEQEQITKRFYNDYKQRRLNLFGHLVENNPEINKHILVEKSQKILDRLIFVMFCEDSTNNLLPRNILTDTYNLGKKNRSRSETKIWEQFQYLFEDIDKGRYDIQPNINAYNGGLFAEDLELNNLVIKNEVWEWFNQISEKYDFESDLNVNILGHIFEQSISDIEEIKSEIEVAEGFSLHKGTDISIKVGDSFSFPGAKNGQVNLAPTTTKPKTSKRKKDGIYYTPEYITDYIVSETIGNWLNDQKVPLVRGQAEGLGVVVGNPLESIKVLDPAGGSGAFPNQVHNYLTKKHEAKFKELSKDQNDLFNQVQIDKSILQNNIFTVDLQPESVEIAKLSLWLKTAKKDQKLNNLDENIKCGNSLINDPEIAGERAFDWHKEFPEVMASGGFDVVIGNPPYVGQKGNAEVFEFFKESNWKWFYERKQDLYYYFLVRGIELLKEGGYLGFITPQYWLTASAGRKLRKYLSENTSLVSVLNLSESKVFEDASIHTMCFIFKKSKDVDEIKIRTLDENYKPVDLYTSKIKNSELDENEWNIFKNEDYQEVGEGDEFIKLGEIAHISPGIQTGLDKAGGNGVFVLSNEEYKSLNFSEKEKQIIKPSYKNSQIERYYTEEKNHFWIIITNNISNIDEYPNIKKHLLDYKNLIDNRYQNFTLKNALEKGLWWYLFGYRPDTDFDNNKIIFPYRSYKPKFTLSENPYYSCMDIYFLTKLSKDFNYRYILGCLNSNLISNFLDKNCKKKGNIIEFSIAPISQLPIPVATPEQQIQIAELVDQIMNLKKEAQDYLKNTFILLQAELGGQKITLNKKLEKFWTLDFAEFLSELTKQKIQLSNPQKRNLITSFETDKKKILELEQQVEKVDAEIEGLVRGLYGVD
jgi:hypothetical protein